MIIYTKPGRNFDILVDDNFMLSAISSKKGIIKVHKKSNVGRELLKAISQRRTISLRG